MYKKIISRMHNGLGNQMFIYASSLAFARMMERELLIDDESAFVGYNSKLSIVGKNYKNYCFYGLNIFKISSKICDKNYKIINLYSYIKRKILQKLDFFFKKKKFYFEKKEKGTKLAIFDNSFIKKNFHKNLFLTGHFESEKYFKFYENLIRNEFSFKNELLLKKNSLFSIIDKSNSISICLRRDRFTKQLKTETIDSHDSEKFVIEQINYIYKAIKYLEGKVNKPKFFLWSNNYKNIKNYFNDIEINIINTENIELDLFLMTSCKNFITIPSTFNWWGAWLSKNKNKIVIRPSIKNFSRYRFTNEFWPDDWVSL